MSRHTNRETARAVDRPRCMRCGGELASGFYHLELARCVEVLGRRMTEMQLEFVEHLRDEHNVRITARRT